MAVVPEGPRLIETGKLVGERVACCNRALVHEGSTIRPVRTLLKDTMKMLGTRTVRQVKTRVGDIFERTTEVDFSIVSLVSWSTTRSWNRSP